VNEVTGSSYATGIEAMASGEVDAMLVSPQSYAQAKEKANAELFATTSTDQEYYSVFITQADNDEINDLEDLEGTNFAFVDPSSSSGYLYPKGTLVNELDLDTDQVEQSGYFFDNVLYSGSHDNSVVGVSMGDYEAAAVTNSAYGRMVEAGAVEDGLIKEVGRTPDIPNPSYVMRGDLPEDFKEALKEAYYSFDDSEYFEAIHGNPDTRLVEIDESYYAEALETLELIGAAGGEE
jgi:phosphonate transport system substrate-binding protein